MSTQQLSMIRNGMMSTAIRNHGMTESRAHAIAMYSEAAAIYGLTGNDRRLAISWCLAQSGYGGGL